MFNCTECKEPPYAERHVRWCERSVNESRKKTFVFLLLDLCLGVSVAFRCASGRCASFQAVLSRFGWLFPAAPGLSLLVPCSAEHKIGIFVRFLASGLPFSGLSSTKSGFLCQNGPFFRDFWSF